MFIGKRGKPVKVAPQPSAQRRHDHASGDRRLVLKPDHPAATDARTVYPSTVKFVEEVPRVLIEGHNSRKIGKVVTKGAWKGFPIYTLTLQERATCPATCQHWLSCYGNHMHLARRVHADADFEDVLWLELEALNKAHPVGFVVRLHVLGDFYSVDYVALWRRALLHFPALNVFGYTARDPDKDPIGRALKDMSDQHFSRFALRFSGRRWGLQGAITVDKGERPKNAVVCPAQTGGTECCATCGLCWTMAKTVAFERH